MKPILSFKKVNKLIEWTKRLSCLIKVRSKVALGLRLYQEHYYGDWKMAKEGTASPEAISEAKSKDKVKTILPGNESAASISEILTCAV